jgi:GNAT superfamily N-acetyltransferase
VKKEMVRISDERAYVPFVYLNYIAVRADYQNQKIGTVLLMNALSRCGQVVRNVGIYGIALNALTERAAKLYERYGFRQISATKYPFMILPTQSLIDLTENEADRTTAT